MGPFPADFGATPWRRKVKPQPCTRPASHLTHLPALSSSVRSGGRVEVGAWPRHGENQSKLPPFPHTSTQIQQEAGGGLCTCEGRNWSARDTAGPVRTARPAVWGILGCRWQSISTR